MHPCYHLLRSICSSFDIGNIGREEDIFCKVALLFQQSLRLRGKTSKMRSVLIQILSVARMTSYYSMTQTPKQESLDTISPQIRRKLQEHALPLIRTLNHKKMVPWSGRPNKNRFRILQIQDIPDLVHSGLHSNMVGHSGGRFPRLLDLTILKRCI